MHFTTTFYDGIPHIFNHTRQLVCTDVGMGICQDGGTGAMLAEYIQNFVHIPSLFASETVVAFRGNFVLTADTGDIYFSIAYILTSFHYDRPES